MIIILMGVSGAGKTTVGRRLATALDCPFYEGDDFHPPANVAKMARGVPLTDADRRPWLAALRTLIEKLLAEGETAVLTCSALKKSYRRRLKRGNEAVRFVHLKGSFALISGRLAEREGHFMPDDLLASQFAALQESGDVLTVSIANRPADIVAEITAALGLKGSDQ